MYLLSKDLTTSIEKAKRLMVIKTFVWPEDSRLTPSSEG